MQKNKQEYLSIIYDYLAPMGWGIFFTIWVVSLLKHSVMYFPIITIPIIILYYFSGNIFSAILTSIAVITGILECLFFVEIKTDIYMLLLECLAILSVYLILELYRRRYINIENKFLIEQGYLNNRISEKKIAILENNTIADNLSRKIKNFRKIGNILQTFHYSLSEKEIIYKSEDIAFSFFEKGVWKLRKYDDNDKIASYIKQTSNRLIVYNIKKDDRFENMPDEKMSIVAVSIEFNGIFWGILEGSSHYEKFFSADNLQQLSMLSVIISIALSNFYLYKQLQSLAIRDGLTGLYTNAYFKERLSQELNRSMSNKIPFSLGLLDIDCFKEVNDKYGHQSGDFVLRSIASILRLNFRKSDFIARYGGEEFAFMMLHTSSKEAFKILEKIRTLIEQEDFFIPIENLLPVRLKVTASIGFVSLRDKAQPYSEEFLKNADKALYRAKHLGKNRVEEYIYE